MYSWKQTFLLPLFLAALSMTMARGQTSNAIRPSLAAEEAASDRIVDRLTWPDTSASGAEGNATPVPSEAAKTQGHVISRSVKRALEDQKEIYKAPFRPSNLKWDALVLGGSALFFATDRHIENNLPGGHYQLYQDSSNIAIGGLAAGLAGVWIYGIKTDHHHARETGALELEALADSFFLYLPMQLIAGRQRPGEGNGHGDFLKHHAMNTSFPGGHAMFMWTMATVLSHEYSQKWVQAAAYGSAFTLTLSRFLARDHWASDMWVGTALGIGVGAHVFHAHCDPELSPKCRRHEEKLEQKLHIAPASLYRPHEYYSGLLISQ